MLLVHICACSRCIPSHGGQRSRVNSLKQRTARCISKLYNYILANFLQSLLDDFPCAWQSF